MRNRFIQKSFAGLMSAVMMFSTIPIQQVMAAEDDIVLTDDTSSSWMKNDTSENNQNYTFGGGDSDTLLNFSQNSEESYIAQPSDQTNTLFQERLKDISKQLEDDQDRISTEVEWVPLDNQRIEIEGDDQKYQVLYSDSTDSYRLQAKTMITMKLDHDMAPGTVAFSVVGDMFNSIVNDPNESKVKYEIKGISDFAVVTNNLGIALVNSKSIPSGHYDIELIQTQDVTPEEMREKEKTLFISPVVSILDNDSRIYKRAESPIVAKAPARTAFFGMKKAIARAISNGVSVNPNREPASEYTFDWSQGVTNGIEHFLVHTPRGENWIGFCAAPETLLGTGTYSEYNVNEYSGMQISNVNLMNQYEAQVLAGAIYFMRNHHEFGDFGYPEFEWRSDGYITRELAELVQAYLWRTVASCFNYQSTHTGAHIGYISNLVGTNPNLGGPDKQKALFDAAWNWSVHHLDTVIGVENGKEVTVSDMGDNIKFYVSGSPNDHQPVMALAPPFQLKKTPVVIEANKMFNGTSDMKGKDFRFKLERMHDDKTTVHELVSETSADANGHIQFDPFWLSEKTDAWFRITEIKGDDSNIQYDTSQKFVRVKAWPENGGTWKSSVEYEGGSPIFYNANPPQAPDKISVTMNAQKLLDNSADMKGNEFEFDLYRVGDDGTETHLMTKKADASGQVSFSQEHRNLGNYTYRIKEKAGTNAAINYDTAVKTVHVAITQTVENNKYVLHSNVTYENNDNTFHNSYKRGSLKIIKAVTGSTDTAKEFTFKLSINGVEKETFKLKAGQSKTFENLVHGSSYKVEEVNLPGGYSTDQAVFTGTIEATKTITVTCTNKYGATGQWSPIIQKKMRNDVLKDDQYSFTLSDANGKVLQTKKNKADGTVPFDALNYSKVDDGKTYTYTIKEVKGDNPSIMYDESVYTVSVSIADNQNGTLNVTAKYKKGSADVDKAVFENILTIEMPSTGENTVLLLSAVLAMAVLGFLYYVRKKTNLNA